MKKITTGFSLFLFILLSFSGCKTPDEQSIDKSNRVKNDVPFTWDNASVYFLLTDRFYNGDPSNDTNFGRTKQTATLRGFKGGDLKGVTQKIREGYFNELGITAIWFTPVVEQIHGIVDEGTGDTYGYHGYWAKDWTSLDPNFGTEEELTELVNTAHEHGIRIIMDVVLNHTGPVTEKDLVWPEEWVRTDPKCEYQDYESTVFCTLVENLPDIKTENNNPVELPDILKQKWQKEGRLETEMDELDAFFEKTGYPRAPRFYIIKWLIDFIKKYGIDGFRIDTAKHVEESVWAELWQEAVKAFAQWKAQHPDLVLDDNDFYLLGEVYGYNISSGRQYDFGDKRVDFFDYGFHALLNFEFKSDANKSYEQIFSKYSNLIHNNLQGKSVLNYISSHDDSHPFDKFREKPFESATKLMLCPGAVQVYYGDESMRELEIPGAKGDAHLRSFMNWEEIEQNNSRNGYNIKEVLEHWQKLGRFRRNHPAVGAGAHQKLSQSPYIFARIYQHQDYSDVIVAGLDLETGKKEIPVAGYFPEGMLVRDYYSDQKAEVSNSMVIIDSPFHIVLLGE
jgi:alpha-amylase